MTSAGPGDRWLLLTPRDTVVVRDGRAFDAGQAGAAAGVPQTVSPWPSTVAGAVGAAFEASRGAVGEPATVRGPVVARWEHSRWGPYFPVPADVVLESDEVDERRPRARRLRPASLSGAGVTSDLAGEVEQWFIPPEDAESVEPVGGLWDRDLMADYLADDLPDPIELYEDSWERLSPLLPERRVGLAREGRTAKDGFLYSTTHLRSRESRGTSWGFLAAVADSPATSGVAPAGPVPLGGRMRLADVAEVDGVDWPAAPEEFPGGRVLVYVATPALWPAGWRPPLPADASLVAACTSGPRPVPIASTRQARHAGTGLLETVVLRWAVEPGSVYLLRFPDVGRAGQWAADVHGRSLGPALDRAGGSATAGQGTVGTDRTSTAGFGVVLCGRWTEGP